MTKSENGFIYYRDKFGEMIIPQPSLIGDHQLFNISTSIAASRKIFNISNTDIKNSMKKLLIKFLLIMLGTIFLFFLTGFILGFIEWWKS